MSNAARRESRLDDRVDITCCPHCKKRVAVGIQCTGCNQWWHNKPPCTTVYDTSIHCTPFLCCSCLELAQRIEDTSRQFPTVKLRSTWTELPAGELGLVTSATQDDDDDGASPLRTHAMLNTVRMCVKAQLRYGLSSAEVVQPERLLSAVYRINNEFDSNSDSDEVGAEREERLDSEQPLPITMGSESKEVVSLLRDSVLVDTPPSVGNNSCRHRFRAHVSRQEQIAAALADGSYVAPLDGLRVKPKLSSCLTPSKQVNSFGGVDNELSDVIVDLEGVTLSPTLSRTSSQARGFRSQHSVGASLLKRKSTMYMMKCRDKDALRDHFDNTAFQQLQQQSLSADGSRRAGDINKIKAALLTRVKQKKRHNESGENEGKSSSPSRHTDPFSSTRPLAASTRRVVESHKRMYFADLPPSLVAFAEVNDERTRKTSAGKVVSKKLNHEHAHVRLSHVDEVISSMEDSGSAHNEEIVLEEGDRVGSLESSFCVGRQRGRAPF